MIEFKKYKKNIFISFGEIEVWQHQEQKEVIIDGILYSTDFPLKSIKVNLEIDCINFIKNNNKNKLKYLYYSLDYSHLFPNVKFKIYYPDINYIRTNFCYSENNFINLNMQVLYNNSNPLLKIKGVEFFTGKTNEYNFKKIFTENILKGQIKITLDSYGFNNGLFATIKFKYLFKYNIQNICKLCNYYNDFLKKYIPENIENKNKNDIMINLFKLQSDLKKIENIQHNRFYN